MIQFGQGDPNIEDSWIPNPDRYWDMAQWFSRLGSYTDFEGFAGPRHVREILAHPRVLETIELYADVTHLEVGAVHAEWNAEAQAKVNESEKERVRELLKDLVAHFVYECEDQADYELDENDVTQFIHHIAWLLVGSRYYMKRNAT